MLPMRQKHYLGALLALSLLLALTPQLGALPSGINGASINNGCSCHSSVADESVIPSIEGLPETFVAGEAYIFGHLVHWRA